MHRAIRAFFTGIGESAWVLFSFFLVAIAVGLTANHYQFLRDFFTTTQGALWSGALVYVLVVGLVILPLWIRRGRAMVMRTLGVDKRPSRELWWLPYVTWVGYMVATIVVAAAVGVLFPWIDQTQQQNVGFSNLSQPYEFVLAFIGLVVLPPIAEETLFRGYLFGRLRPRLGFWFTALVVSAIFGLVHLQWNVGIDVAVLSLFMCYLRERTGAIWAGMVVHAIKNGLAYYLLFIAPLHGFNLL